MIDRQATFLACDDVLLALNGKMFINGIYTADIVIPTNEAQINQLIIFVMADTPIERPFRSFVILVKLPGEDEPKTFDAMPFILGLPPTAAPGRGMLKVRVPFLIQQTILRPGAIEVSIVHEEGTTLAGRQWVQLASVSAPSASKH